MKNNRAEWVGFLAGIGLWISPFVYFVARDGTQFLSDSIGFVATTLWILPFAGWIGFVIDWLLESEDDFVWFYTFQLLISF